MDKTTLLTVLDEVKSMFDEGIDYTGEEIAEKIEKVQQEIRAE